MYLNQRRRKHKRTHIVIFSGGSGVREIHIELAKTCHITRVLPVCDNGGSSKVLRQYFNIMPVGDIRQALVTAAQCQQCDRAILRLLNWRLPKNSTVTQLHREMAAFSLVPGQKAATRPIPGSNLV